MTVKEYIERELKPFGVTDVTDVLLDGSLDGDSEYDVTTRRGVGLAMVNAIAEMIYKPRVSSVNENGFSISWDIPNLSKYYLYLCKKWGVTPDEEISKSGLDTITDISNYW